MYIYKKFYLSYRYMNWFSSIFFNFLNYYRITYLLQNIGKRKTDKLHFYNDFKKYDTIWNLRKKRRSDNFFLIKIYTENHTKNFKFKIYRNKL